MNGFFSIEIRLKIINILLNKITNEKITRKISYSES